MKLVEQIPDLDHLWIRYLPRPWPGESRHLWLDLASLGLGRASGRGGEAFDAAAFAAADDVVYLPPVDPEHADDRRKLARHLSERSVTLVEQVVVGFGPGQDGESPVYDLLHGVATEAMEGFSSVASGSRAVWPLVAGYTDDPEVWERGIGLLAAAGVTAIYGVVADLSPEARRRIVEIAGERGYDALFHGRQPTARPFAKAVHRRGLEALPMRPATSALGRVQQNRHLAGQLASIAELSLRLGMGETRAQAFFRAARWIDREPHDLAALVRDGNLAIVSWLDQDCREQVEELVDTGSSRLLDDLCRQYLGDA